jgi:hypothetical protein
MFRMILLVALLLSYSSITLADHTGRGKVISTQGHISPACRTVSFRVNGHSEVLHFRIANVDGDDDINTLLLTALVADREVDIYFDPGVTSGCGTEQRITYITIF